MQDQINGFCLKGYPAEKVCNNLYCRHHSIMCSKQSCECHKVHSECGMYFSFPLLTKKLTIKGLSTLNLKTSIIEWCQMQIKRFNIIIQDLHKSIDNDGLMLDGDEGTLFQLLKRKRFQQVTSNLVYKAVKSLLREPKIDIQDKIDKLQRRMKEVSQTIQKAVQNIRSIRQNNFDLAFKTNFNFSESLHHCDMNVYGNSIQNTNPNDYWKLGLIQPAILITKDSQKSKVRFRIVSSPSQYIYFGVCQLKGETTRRFWSEGLVDQLSEDKAILSANNGGKLCFSGKDIQNSMQSYIKDVKVGDVLDVSFDPLTMTVYFLNQSTGKSESITIIQLITHPMYFCVVILDEDTVIELI